MQTNDSYQFHNFIYGGSFYIGTDQHMIKKN